MKKIIVLDDSCCSNYVTWVSGIQCCSECGKPTASKHVESIILNDGEFVARWDECPSCKGKGNREIELTVTPRFKEVHVKKCWKCNGTGRIAVPVEEGK